MQIDHIGIQSIIDFFNGCKDIILILDEDLGVKYANNEAENLFPLLKGKALGEISLGQISDFIKISAVKDCKNLKDGDYKTLEVYNKEMDSWFRMDVGSLESFGYLIILTDITEKIKLRKKLDRSNEMYNAFMNASFDNIYEYDPKTDKISQLKARGISIFENVENPKALVSRTHPDDVPLVEKKFEEAALNKKNFNIEYRFLCPKGDYIWIRAKVVPIIGKDGNVKKWIGISNDITLEKEFELRLIEKEKEYFQLLDTSTIGFFIMDYEKKEAKVSESWKKKLKMKDLNSSDLYLGFYDLIHPEDVESIKKLDKDSMAKGKEKYDSEYRIRMPDGNYIWVLYQSKIIYDKRGKPIKSYKILWYICGYNR